MRTSRFANKPMPAAYAHWSIFLPTLIIAVLFGGVWIGFAVSGRAGDAIARLSIFVVAVICPLLLVHAFLRYKAFAILIGRMSLWYVPGWLWPGIKRVPIRLIHKVHLRRNPLQRKLGAGAVIIETWGGKRLVFPDVAEAESHVEELRERLWEHPGEGKVSG